MRFARKVQSLNSCMIRFGLVGPQGAMSLTVTDVGDYMSGDVFYHAPCFSRECDDPRHNGPCDLLGEMECHCDGRGIGELTSIDDDRIFEFLESLYETDIAHIRR